MRSKIIRSKKIKALSLITVMVSIATSTLVVAYYFSNGMKHISTSRLGNEEDQAKEALLSFMNRQVRIYQRYVNECFQENDETVLNAESCPAMQSIFEPKKTATLRCLKEFDVSSNSERSPCTLDEKNLPKIFELTASVTEAGVTRRGRMTIESRYPKASDFILVARSINRNEIVRSTSNNTGAYSHCRPNAIESYYFDSNLITEDSSPRLLIDRPQAEMNVLTNLPKYIGVLNANEVVHCDTDTNANCTPSIQSTGRGSISDFEQNVHAIYGADSTNLANELVSHENELLAHSQLAFPHSYPTRMWLSGSNGSCTIQSQSLMPH